MAPSSRVWTRRELISSVGSGRSKRGVRHQRPVELQGSLHRPLQTEGHPRRSRGAAWPSRAAKRAVLQHSVDRRSPCRRIERWHEQAVTPSVTSPTLPPAAEAITGLPRRHRLEQALGESLHSRGEQRRSPTADTAAPHPVRTAGRPPRAAQPPCAPAPRSRCRGPHPPEPDAPASRPGQAPRSPPRWSLGRATMPMVRRPGSQPIRSRQSKSARSGTGRSTRSTTRPLGITTSFRAGVPRRRSAAATAPAHGDDPVGRARGQPVLQEKVRGICRRVSTSGIGRRPVSRSQVSAARSRALWEFTRSGCSAGDDLRERGGVGASRAGPQF